MHSKLVKCCFAAGDKIPLYYENFNITDVVTPVNVVALQGLLTQSNYDKNKTRYLVNGFRQGFSIGYNSPTEIRHFAPNLKLQIGSKIKLWNKVMKEVKLLRYAGPFSEVPFKNFIQSPIGLVPKGSDGKDCRLIFHLSYPKDGLSVNSAMPKELCSVAYPDFGEAVQLCIKAGKSCKIARSNMSAAFRQLGIKPNHWPWLILKCESPFDGQVYYFLDKALPFRSSISCAHFQEFSSAIAWIVTFRTGQDNINYLDNYLFVSLLTLFCNGQVEQFLMV